MAKQTENKETKDKPAYEKPFIKKETQMNFPVEIIDSLGSKIVCRQCSGCHGCC